MRIFFLLTLIFGFIGCYTQIETISNTKETYEGEKRSRQIEFTKSIIDKMNEGSLPDSGFYYKYKFVSYKDRIENVDLFLTELYKDGYNIVSAWYRPGSTSCYDGNIVTSVVVLPTFIILLSDNDYSLQNFNFSYVVNKPGIACPYQVAKYTPLLK